MNKLTRLLVLALSLALLVGAMIGFGITSSADEEPTVSVAGKNMSYTGAVQVMYYIKTTGTVDMDNVRLLVSNDEFSVTTEDNVADLDANISVKVCRGTLTPETGSLAGASYGIFYSDGIAPVELRQAINAVPVIVDAEGNITYVGAASNNYSPYQYAMNRFSAGSTDIQRTLYKALLDYGASVQAVLLKTDEEVAKVGGWADAYYNVKVDTYVDGVLTAEGTAAPCRAAATINADSSLDSSKLFIGFTNGAGYNYIYDEGKNVAITSMTCSSLKDPGTYTVVKNYSTKHGTTQSFDTFAQSNVTLSGATYITEDPAADSHGYVLHKNGTLTVGSNNMYHKGTAAGNNGSALIKPTSTYTKGDYYVIDTDFTLNTNYLLASGTDWVLKLYPCGGDSISDYNEIFNIPIYVGNGSTFSIGDHNYELGVQHHIRMVIIPRTDTKVDYCIYVDGERIGNTIGVNYLGQNLNGKKDKTTLTFGGLVVGYRYSGSLKAHTGTDPLSAAITFDNTFIGAIPGEYTEEFNYNDFKDAQSLQGIGANNNYTISDLVSNGKLELPMKNGGGIYFKPVRPITGGDADDRYVFEMDFTYNGGKKKAVDGTDLGTGFIGFSWTEGGGDDYMYWYSKITLNGTPDANGVYPSVKFYDRVYEKGVNYKIRYEYNPGNATIDIFENGEHVYTVDKTVAGTIDKMTASSTGSTKAVRSNTGMYKGSVFKSFSILFRGAGSTHVEPTATSFTIDNTYCGYTTADITSDILFNLNEGTGNILGVTLKPGETFTIPGAVPTKTLAGSDIASEFLGWKNGYSYVYRDPNVVTEDVMVADGAWYSLAPTTLTAKWHDPIKVTLVNEGNSSDKFFWADGDYDLGIPKHSTLAPEKFLGWHYGTTNVETKGNGWTLGTNITLDAWWDVAYDVNFDAGEGSFIGDEPTLKLNVGDEFTLPASSTMTAPNGKTFVGWYIGERFIDQTGVWKYEKDVTLVAKWASDLDVYNDTADGSTTGSTYMTRNAAYNTKAYSNGTTYVVEFSFTYLGGSPKADGAVEGQGQPAFFSLVSNSAGNQRIKYSMLTYDTSTTLTIGDTTYYENVTLNGLKFEINKTYRVRFVCTIDTTTSTTAVQTVKSYIIDEDGNIVLEKTLGSNNNGINASTFYSFVIETRSSHDGPNGCKYRIEDALTYVIEPQDADA